jgi:hypothetical protein
LFVCKNSPLFPRFFAAPIYLFSALAGVLVPKNGRKIIFTKKETHHGETPTAGLREPNYEYASYRGKHCG